MKNLQLVSQEFIDEHGFLTLDDDYVAKNVRDAVYVVLTPDKDNPLKTSITYYTNRKKSTSSTIEGNPDGTEWVYVLAHPTDPDLYKIGYTSKDPKQRLNEINSQTGVVGEYRLIYMYKTINGYQLEHAVHSYFKDVRIHPRKEHFQINRKKIIQVIQQLGVLYG
jgi:hypothetical protein